MEEEERDQMEEDIEADEEDQEKEDKLNKSVDFEEFRQIIENNEDESKNKASQAR
jgi:hypothetical protein